HQCMCHTRNHCSTYIYCTNKYYVHAIGLDEKNELTVSRDFMELPGITYDWKDQKLYIDKIHQMNFNGTRFFLRALAIDQIERKLYQLLDTLDICVSELVGCCGIKIQDIYHNQIVLLLIH
ncbi:unnamed protein product, partial [Rotaria sp. Silwood1]